jgi:hypothetical protein
MSVTTVPSVRTKKAASPASTAKGEPKSARRAASDQHAQWAKRLAKPLRKLVADGARLMQAQAHDAPALDPGAPCIFDHDAPLHRYVHAWLLWEAGSAQADAALERLRAGVVDINELRAGLTEEIVELLGPGYPRAVERAAGLKAALGELFRREHALRLAHLSAMGKRAAWTYLHTLPRLAPQEAPAPGLPAQAPALEQEPDEAPIPAPRFVAALVAMHELKQPVLPLDGALSRPLRDAAGLPAPGEGGPSDDELATICEGLLAPGEAPAAYAALRALADRALARAAPRSKPGAPAKPKPAKRGAKG